MGFVLSLLIAFPIFFFGTRLFERHNLPIPIDSLRMGRLHYALLGIFVGLFLPKEEALFLLFEGLRDSLIGIALTWFGFQTGLNFDLGRFRTHPSRQFLAEGVGALVTFLLVFLGVMAGRPLLNTYLGVGDNLTLVALLLGVFATSFRTPEPVFYRRKKILPSSICANPIALILFGAVFPFVGGNTVLQLGSFTAVGYTNNLFILIGLGLLLGITLDFIFYAHRDGLRCIYLTVGMTAAIGGLCLHLQIPGIFVGFIGGGWLINTTVRRRDVLELAERAGTVAEPIFFTLLGTLISAGSFFELHPLVPFAILLLLSRGIIRMLGVAAGWHLSSQNRTWWNTIETGWRPLGVLSAALVVQGLYLPLQLAHNTLIAGALLAVFLSQAFVIPPSAEAASPQPGAPQG